MESLIAIEHCPSYRVVTVLTPAQCACEQLTTTVALSIVRQDPERYLGPLVCAPGLSLTDSYEKVLDLALTMPGVPLGLTFDGGIAVTQTDYRLAVQRWEQRQSED